MKYTFVILSLLFISLSYSQDKKSLNIVRTDKAPKIDGVLDDDAWQNVEVATDFIQFRPEMGVTLKPHQKTIVKMTYDDDAIYVAAYLMDKPEGKYSCQIFR